MRYWKYQIYNLTISTPFPCLGLQELTGDISPDVVVMEGSVPRQLDNPIMGEGAWEVADGQYLFRGGRLAGRFLVENGERVILQRNSEAEDAKLAFYFLDTVLAALLRQRGYLVLHANAAAAPSGAVAVSGVSGAGKSTTLAALLMRGCQMLSDDVTALKLDSAGRVVALPGIPLMHLTEDAAEGLGADIEGMPRYSWRRMKAAVPTHEEMATEAVELRALFLIEPTEGRRLRVYTVEGTEKFAGLQSCIYGPLLASEHPQVFPLFAAVSSDVKVFRIERPQELWTADEIAERMLQEVNERACEK